MRIPLFVLCLLVLGCDSSDDAAPAAGDTGKGSASGDDTADAGPGHDSAAGSGGARSDNRTLGGSAAGGGGAVAKGDPGKQATQGANMNGALTGTLFYGGPTGMLLGVDLASGVTRSHYPEAGPRGISADASEVVDVVLSEDKTEARVEIRALDGTPHKRFVISATDAGFVQLSPDNKWVGLYVSESETSAALCIYDRDGRRVAAFPEAIGPYAFMPDGRLLIARERELLVTERAIDGATTPALKSIRRFDQYTPHSLAVSPSGKHIAFALLDEKTSHLYTLDSSGDNLRQLTAHAADAIAPLGEYAPTWVGEDHLAFAYGKQVDNYWLTLPVPTIENPTPVVNPGPCGEVRLIKASADKVEVYKSPDVTLVNGTDASGDDTSLGCTFAPMVHRSASLPAANQPGSGFPAAEHNRGLAGKLYYYGFLDGSDSQDDLELDLASGTTSVALPGELKTGEQVVHVTGFTLSADGKRMGMLTSWSDAAFDRYVAIAISDRDGSNVASLSTSGEDTFFTGGLELSNDGNLAAVGSLYDHTLLVFRRDGSSLRQLGALPEANDYAFGGSDLYVLADTGLSRVRATDAALGTPELVLAFDELPATFSISPDGKSIAYSQYGHVWMRGLGSGDPKAPAQRVTASGGIELSPEFSPDGRALLLRFVEDDLEQCSQLWIVPSDAREVHIGDRARDLQAFRVEEQTKGKWGLTSCAFSRVIWR